jgi:hypothetical protein
VILAMSKFWTLEFNFQLIKILKEQRQTGKKALVWCGAVKKYFHKTFWTKINLKSNNNKTTKSEKVAGNNIKQYRKRNQENEPSTLGIETAKGTEDTPSTQNKRKICAF